MKKWIHYFVFCLCLLGGSQWLSSSVMAEEETPTGFNYQVIKPDNQHDSEVGYFDLRMKPGQNQTVQIELSNPSAVEKTVEVHLNGAKTNGGGVLEYGPNKLENDPSLKYDFAKLVKGPKTVTIPPRGTKMLDLTIQMPETSFDGIIAGGIQLKAAQDKEKLKKQSGIVNEYAFIVGMVLSETDQPITPELKLNQVYAGQSNYRNSVYIDFSNVQPTFLNHLTLQVQIMKKGSSAVLYDTKKSNMRVAPNSKVKFPVSMNGEKMQPGNYKAHILATLGEQKWEWTSDFKISDEQADKFNEEDVDLAQDTGINWPLILMIVVIVLLVFGGVFAAIRISQRKKNGSDKKRKKKSSSTK